MSSITIVVGAHDYSTTAETQRTKRYGVEKVAVHEGWWTDKMVDIALVRVEGSIDLNVHTPLCLPDPGFDVRRSNIVLAGE